MRLDHVNVRCTDLDTTRAFFESAVGLKPGWRPPFVFPGYWLVDGDGRAVVHLIGARSELGPAGAVDHVAFRYDDLTPQLAHLRERGHAFELRLVPETDIHQCFVMGPDGLQIEFQGPLKT